MQEGTEVIGWKTVGQGSDAARMLAGVEDGHQSMAILPFDVKIMPRFGLKVAASPDSENEEGRQRSERKIREWRAMGQGVAL